MAQNKVQMTVDTSRAERKLSALLKDIEEGANLVAEDVGQVGKNYARLKAPYYSGRTFRLIKLKRMGGGEAQIVAQNPTASDGHTRKIANFNLVRWMHTSGKARRHIHSGDPRFMYTTREYLKSIASVKGQKRFDKITVKYR